MKKRLVLTLIALTGIMMSVLGFGSAANTTPSHIIIKNLAYPVTLTELDLHSMNLTNADIQVLSYMKNLKRLNISENQITDLSPISGLTGLDYLETGDNIYLTDLSPLSRLTNLELLEASGCRIVSLTPLRNLTKLEYLEIAYNNISDVSIIGNFRKLNKLYLNNNNITNVSELRYCTLLTELNVDTNNISNITAFSGMYNLSYLGLHNNNISGGINFIANLDNLTCLEIYNNPIDREVLELLGMLLPLGCRYVY